MPCSRRPLQRIAIRSDPNSKKFSTAPTDLPPECRRTLAPDDAGLALLVEQLSEEGSEEVLARLAAGNPDGAR
jgi:hypothetical protein